MVPKGKLAQNGDGGRLGMRDVTVRHNSPKCGPEEAPGEVGPGVLDRLLVFQPLVLNNLLLNAPFL